jgi:heme exporter protein C
MLTRFANPTRFLGLARTLSPWCAGLAAVCIAAGLVFALFVSPPDYQQGETVRIMYIHVPSAQMAMFGYAVVALASAVGLIWRHPLAHIAAREAAPIGACFTAICLITGSLWGKPMWGAWWVWDARLTSVLILFFLYLGYMALAEAFDDPARGEKASAVLALVGAINVPIIKFSVDWWNTLHQPASIVRMGGPKIDPAMLWPLGLMSVGFLALFLWLHLVRIKGGIHARRLRALRLARAHGEAATVRSTVKA